MKALLLPSQVSSPSTPSLPSLSLYLRGPCVSSQSPRFRAHVGIHIHNPLPLCRLFFPPPIRLTGAQAHAKMRFSHCGRTCIRVTFPFSSFFFFFDNAQDADVFWRGRGRIQGGELRRSMTSFHPIHEITTSDDHWRISTNCYFIKKLNYFTYESIRRSDSKLCIFSHFRLF